METAEPPCTSCRVLFHYFLLPTALFCLNKLNHGTCSHSGRPPLLFCLVLSGLVSQLYHSVSILASELCRKEEEELVLYTGSWYIVAFTPSVPSAADPSSSWFQSLQRAWWLSFVKKKKPTCVWSSGGLRSVGGGGGLGGGMLPKKISKARLKCVWSGGIWQ